MTKTIDITVLKTIAAEIRADMAALLAERNPIYPDEPMYASARDALRFNLSERRREWVVEARAATLADYESGLRIAARRAHTAAASPAQIKYLAKLAFAAGEPVDGLLRSGALCTRQASHMIDCLKGV